MRNRALVLDANILVRAVLGHRVRDIIGAHAKNSSFFVPTPAYSDAEEHLPVLISKRGGDPEKALAVLKALAAVVDLVRPDVYNVFEDEARERLVGRDADDWPILATALALSCPIWTEDTDFFGCGVATWTSTRVQIFLRN